MENLDFKAARVPAPPARKPQILGSRSSMHIPREACANSDGRFERVKAMTRPANTQCRFGTDLNGTD
jgi:hypothetical protein